MFVFFFLLFAEGKVTSCKAAGTAFMRKMSVRLMSMYVIVLIYNCSMNGWYINYSF